MTIQKLTRFKTKKLGLKRSLHVQFDDALDAPVPGAVSEILRRPPQDASTIAQQYREISFAYEQLAKSQERLLSWLLPGQEPVNRPATVDFPPQSHQADPEQATAKQNEAGGLRNGYGGRNPGNARLFQVVEPGAVHTQAH